MSTVPQAVFQDLHCPLSWRSFSTIDTSFFLDREGFSVREIKDTLPAIVLSFLSQATTTDPSHLPRQVLGLFLLWYTQFFWH